MEIKRIFDFVMLFLLAATALADENTLSVLVGDTANLECPIAHSCGPLHSIKWYRENKRIAILAEPSNFVKIEGEMKDRLKVSLSSLKDLKISPVTLDDDGQYKCELTYLEPSEKCESIHEMKLKTLLKPKSMMIFDQNRKEIRDGSPLGGLLENSDTTVECRVDGGKPVPTLKWIIGDNEVSGDVSTTGEGEETVTINRLVFSVERKLQGKQLQCAVTSEALEEPMTTNLTLDLILLPTTLTISGVKHHVVQGSKVTLECLSEGARPPAIITWSNDTQSIPADQTLTLSEPHEDGTYDTTSRLSFWTTRWDHNRTFSCESRQLAIPLDQGDNALNKSQVLDVHYPPVVYVQPDNVVVNETTDVLLFCEFEANPMRLFSVKWFQNSVLLDLKASPDHYEGGNLEQQSLLIKNSSEKDIGNYSCQIENFVGSSVIEDFVYVDVHFVPEVELVMEPDNFVIENAKQNVTLVCNVIRGNPSTLLEVEWYLDDEYLITTPNCNNSDSFSEDMCNNVETDRLLLEEAGRSFHGKYSCKAKTLAGWGQRSNESELIVNYEPGEASLIFMPQKVIKGGSVNLTCSVNDYGRPPAIRYQWHRGTQLIPDIVTPYWFIMPVTLETETNFTCRAVNLAGTGEPAVAFIEVLAPPTFITNLTSYTGKVYNSSEISLTCRIECSPLCDIGWMKNDKVIEVTGLDQDLYNIENIQLPPDFGKNYFESVQSELIFNMTNWPEGVLNRDSDSDNYTCFSLDNGIGQSIKSSTILGVEFPPENLAVSNKVISVEEEEIPEEVVCSASGNPEPKYVWKRYNLTNSGNENAQIQEEILTEGDTLILKEGVKRTDSGDVVCEVSNIHGSVEITVYLNVMYKPECTITQTEMNDEKVLICTADANPTEVEFDWSMEEVNDTIENEAIIQRGLQSIIKLELLSLDENPRTFSCIVNNTVGVSEPCVYTVQGILPWWKWWSRTALLVAAGIGILILLVILLCIIIFCICRRKRAASKYMSSTPMDDHDSSHAPNETSIVQAIVSQSIPGISPKSQIPTTPQYSEKSRLVPSQNKFILPQSKTKPSNKNPLASSSTGRLQADLSLLEASYQASLLAGKQKTGSCTNLDNNETTNSNIVIEKTPIKDIIENPNSANNNNNVAEVGDNNLKSSSETQGLTVNKWPLKPGVLVHVNSNHSLSPKNFNRTIVKTDESTNNSNENEIKVDIPATNTAESAENKTTSSFDPEKCANIMKQNNAQKHSTISRIFKKIDITNKIGKSKGDDAERLANVEKQDNKKRTKSNKMALSLIGFSIKDETTNKNKGIKSIFQEPKPLVVSTEGVVTYRRPPKTTNNIQSDDISKQNLIDKSSNDDDLEDHDTNNQSRSSSSSRKRKKPGEAPMNGAADGSPKGVENPGLYENLPFHGLQQAPNKPVQVIQPRVIRALVGQNSSKTPESVLEKQLECNPSFTPRILSCAPFLHNPNINSKSLTIYNGSVPKISSIADSNKPTLSNINNPLYLLPSNRNFNEISNVRGIFNNSTLYDDDNQKFYSLNTKRERPRKGEPRFNSMKIVRKRKLDRFYPSKHRIDYVVINRHNKKNDLRSAGSQEVIYANYPPGSIQNTTILSSIVAESASVSYQNLTDSILIHENSPMSSFHSSPPKNDGKTPTPAPRSSKSPVKIEQVMKIIPNERVYANISKHIAQYNLAASNNLENVHMCSIPKTMPRRTLKTDIELVNKVENVSSNFNSSTFPKRTTKSGILLDESEEKSDLKTNSIPKGKVISSKTPSRNHSFNDCGSLKPREVSKIQKTESVKISPSIVDATPKVKPFVVATVNHKLFDNHQLKSTALLQSIAGSKNPPKPKRKMDILQNNEPESVDSSSVDDVEVKSLTSNILSDCEEVDINEQLEKLGSSIRNFNDLQEQGSTFGKKDQKNINRVIPKQQMMIQPAKVPLQIPKLLPKPVPKIRPIQLKRSQSSLSGIGSSSEYMQQYTGGSGAQDGSLIKAKIRELNLRQNMNNNTVNHYVVKQKLNQTYPSDPTPKKNYHTTLQKHHSFCYFQPIHSAENLAVEQDSEESMGPLIYKPNINKINAYKDQNSKNWIDKRKPFQQIDPKHKESFDKLHELLKRDSNADKNKNVSKKIPATTYTLDSLNRHRYVPKIEDSNNVIKQKRLVYADLDLEDHSKKYNEKVNCNRRLFSKDKTSSDEHKTDNLIELKKKHRTEYATLKFEEIEL